MKYLLILLSLIILQTAEAQKGAIQISAQGKSISTNLLDEDIKKVLVINSKLKSLTTDKLTIINGNHAKEKEYKRSFSIYNENDNSVADLSPVKTAGKYEISLKKLLSKMKAGETFSLYTMAIPRDPNKAALVRVRRVFICRISIT